MTTKRAARIPPQAPAPLLGTAPAPSSLYHRRNVNFPAPTTASLSFRFVEPEEEREFSHILCDFLQTDTKLSPQTAIQKIFKILPWNSPYSSKLGIFILESIEVAELIPYDHPSMLKLVSLIRLVHLAPEFMNNNRQSDRHQRLNQTLREGLNDAYGILEGEGDKLLAVNKFTRFHAFSAQVDCHIFEEKFDPMWAVGTLRAAHESYRDLKGRNWDAYVRAAAIWILIYGDVLFEQTCKEPPPTHGKWFEGERYLETIPTGFLKKRKVTYALTMRRWNFWRSGFLATASGERDSEKDSVFTQECKNLAAKAAQTMKELETEKGANKG